MEKDNFKLHGISFVYHPDSTITEVIRLARKYAKFSNPLLITGETGTGKEQLVRIIHLYSDRPGRLVSANLSAIPKELIENELFGHVKGAFTDANTTTEGLIEKASFGTLFIDEVGELPLEHQIKLLRVIQTNEYEKIGSNKTLKSTARFIFATSKDLEYEIQKERFRADLYYRISAFHIHIPPLRERKEDIPVLVEYFLNSIEEKYKKKITIHPEVIKMFMVYPWPGNVRELENLLYRTAITIQKNEITPEDLPKNFENHHDLDHKIKKLERMKQEIIEYEKHILQEALEVYGGNLYQIAKKLKISRGALQYKIKKYQLK
ncbi:MAG: sigma-54 dependent transcriptional regulator [Leptospiraceae bacterium]|nr:sigma-54 dependent transcriptional regulator [Leptospiraceae bacterium]MDW7975281.1 sigma-54 dependent transcriptional regulator [Leptospiraceae bacterium]